MKRLKFWSVVFGLIFLSIAYYYFFLRHAREKALMKQGREMAQTIELFKVKHKRLPRNLEEIGIKETEEGPLYYAIKSDSTTYMIWFGDGLGESRTYYSDSKKWEDINR